MMRSLFILVVLLLAGTGCGGGGDGSDDIADCFCEPEPEPELPCDPLLQTQCEVGEKCARLVESDEPLLVSTRCVPNGTEPEGAACFRGAAGATGYDNCAAGLDCRQGQCAAICDTSAVSSCRSKNEPFGSGTYCHSFEDGFREGIGSCARACDPSMASLVDGAVVSPDCPGDQTCLASLVGGPVCVAPRSAAADRTQNRECLDPPGGGCYLDGCAPGFAAVRSALAEGEGFLCARVCTPVETDSSDTVFTAGLHGNCEASALMAVGGTNGQDSEHQCRFVQSYYDDNLVVPAQVGACVPVDISSEAGASDCTIFDWDGIKTVWNGAIANADEPSEAFNDYCLVNPSEPASSPFLAQCLGFVRGCISLEEKAVGLMPVAGAPRIGAMATDSN